MPFSVCSLCKVAYDTGAKHCKERWCVEQVAIEHPDLVKVTIKYVDREPPVRNTELPARKIYKRNKKAVAVEYSRWMSCRARAKKKGLEFGLTIQNVKDIIYRPCSYCYSAESLSELDRKDSKLGYTIANVTSACRRCNTIKNNVVSYDEMITIAALMGWR